MLAAFVPSCPLATTGSMRLAQSATSGVCWDLEYRSEVADQTFVARCALGPLVFTENAGRAPRASRDLGHREPGGEPLLAQAVCERGHWAIGGVDRIGGRPRCISPPDVRFEYSTLLPDPAVGLSGKVQACAHSSGVGVVGASRRAPTPR